MDELKKESNKSLWITGIILAVFLVGIITNGFGLLGNNQNLALNVSIGNSPVLGDENAPVTIYEFSDFSCPYCRALATQTMPQVIEEYVNTGKAKIVFKYFPTHAQAEAAHKVAFCLNQQNLFWKFQDLAFTNDNLNDLDKMKTLALSVNANSTKLDSCLSSTNFALEFQKNINMAKENNLKGTPTLVINNKIYQGALPYSEVKKDIDKEL